MTAAVRDDRSTARLLGLFVYGMVLGLASLAVSGGIGAKLWAWFAVPIFGLPHLGWVNTAGLCVLIAVLWPRTPTDPEHKPTAVDMTSRFMGGVALESTLLLMGLGLTVIR